MGVWVEFAYAWLRRLAPWLPALVAATGWLIFRSGVHVEFLPEPVRVSRGNGVDVYSWEGVIASLLVALGAFSTALTIRFDPLAPPESVMMRRSARWVGWMAGPAFIFIAVRDIITLLRLRSY